MKVFCLVTSFINELILTCTPLGHLPGHNGQFLPLLKYVHGEIGIPAPHLHDLQQTTRQLLHI
jgi:hypothetical protein